MKKPHNIPPVNLSALLFALSDAAYEADRTSYKGKKKVVEAFIKFLDELPGAIDENPLQKPKNFAHDLAKVGVAYGHLGPSGQVTIPIGIAFGYLEKKYPGSTPHAMEYLEKCMRGHTSWEYIVDSFLQGKRKNALEIIHSALRETPEIASEKVTKTITEVVALPYLTDVKMMSMMRSNLEKGGMNTPEKLAEDSSLFVRDTLARIIEKKPERTQIILDTLDIVEDTVNFYPFENNSCECLRPVALASIKLARKTIDEAVIKAGLNPKPRNMKEEMGPPKGGKDLMM